MAIEKDWVTQAGLRAVVLMHASAGFRCGYVGVPSGHPLHGVSYDTETPAIKPSAGQPMQSPEMAFDVHGGITFSGSREGRYPVESDLWWFGYDCSHYGDAPSPEVTQKSRDLGLTEWLTGEHRSLEYCVEECESLARQIVDRTIAE